MLDQRIRDHIDAVAAPVTLEEVVGQAPDDLTSMPAAEAIEFELGGNEESPSRRSWLAVAAGFVLAVLLGGFLLSSIQSTEVPVATVQEFVASEWLPVLPGDISMATWQQFEDPFPPFEQGQDVLILDASASNGVAWAVGSVNDLDGSSSEDRLRSRVGAVWRSGDGEVWTPIDVESIVDNPPSEEVELNLFLDVVVTDDGAVWAVGREVLAPDDTSVPIIYRSEDGESWERIEVPSGDFVTSASADGDDLVLVVSTEIAGEVPLSATSDVVRTDGTAWTQVASDVPNDLRVELSGSVVADVSGSEFDTPGFLATEFLAGPSLFVATGEAEIQGDVSEGVEGVEELEGGVDLVADAPALWASTDSDRWTRLEVPAPEQPFRLSPQLFAHSEGVIAMSVWADRESGDGGTSVFDVRSEEVVEYVGEVPVPWLDAMFVLDGQVFLVGLGESPIVGPADVATSVWVSEFDQ